MPTPLQMPLEVEQKFRLPDPRDFEARLAGQGNAVGQPELQIDQYFSHPARDFEITDEALRIRRAGPECFLTYKGPKLDATTKTRVEIELPLPPGDDTAAQFGELLAALGFRPVAEVRKKRRKADLQWQGRSFEIALDEVDGLGTFVELETLPDESQLNAARQSLADLAAHFGLTESERRSYLELILARHV